MLAKLVSTRVEYRNQLTRSTSTCASIQELTEADLQQYEQILLVLMVLEKHQT